jgi:hypothetical protein
MFPNYITISSISCCLFMKMSYNYYNLFFNNKGKKYGTLVTKQRNIMPLRFILEPYRSVDAYYVDISSNTYVYL